MLVSDILQFVVSMTAQPPNKWCAQQINVARTGGVLLWDVYCISIHCSRKMIICSCGVGSVIGAYRAWLFGNHHGEIMSFFSSFFRGGGHILKADVSPPSPSEIMTLVQWYLVTLDWNGNSLYHVMGSDHLTLIHPNLGVVLGGVCNMYMIPGY